MRVFLFNVGLLALAPTSALAADAPAPTAAPPASAAGANELYEAGKQLFDQLAPPEIKARYEFPTKEQWEAFATRLQHALEGESLDELAAYAAEVRAALVALRMVGIDENLADWLEQRLDEIDGAQQAVAPRQPPVPQRPTRPGVPPTTAAVQPVPHYNLWLARVRNRPVPSRAASLLPRVQPAFVAEGVPPELAWLAEAESSFNPSARSPVGAKGLFQFMPETAKAQGLSTFMPDDRIDPEKSARAAARYLRALHGRFGNWALALAAYNAGEGRVSRALAAQKATTFTAIANSLPAETRMYVPKVCALIAIRTGVTPENIGRRAR
ncbi:MAG: lytic transglycosylase domain-containing protein [Opitutaceae bacterium]|nr:lytic transglycosylase domain-containing protein [Opitutaceae bacterium]